MKKINIPKTPLHLICQNKNLNLEIIKLLIEKGSNINEKDKYEKTLCI